MTAEPLSEIKLHSPDGHAYNTEIVIDGHPVRTATGFRFEANADGGFATVHLDLLAQCIDVSGKAKVIIRDETAEALISLGWTPPTQ